MAPVETAKYVKAGGKFSVCGRYTLTVNDLGQVESRFICRSEIKDWRPRFNAAPHQFMPVVVRQEKGNRLKLMRWGLIPFWAKSPDIGTRLINARLETLTEKPAFRHAARRRRCLVPADGYYEWLKEGNRKTPMRIVSCKEDLVAMAGLWDVWEAPDGSVIETYTIVTTEAQGAAARIHHRMPLILPPALEQYWISELEESELKKLLSEVKPFKELRAYQVTALVNSPANDSPDLLREV